MDWLLLIKKAAAFENRFLEHVYDGVAWRPHAHQFLLAVLRALSGKAREGNVGTLVGYWRVVVALCDFHAGDPESAQAQEVVSIVMEDLDELGWQNRLQGKRAGDTEVMLFRFIHGALEVLIKK